MRDSLKLAPSFRANVHVVPYGCPEFVPSSEIGTSKDSKSRVLYVGSLNQSKGLAYLAEAMVGLEDVAALTVSVPAVQTILARR